MFPVLFCSELQGIVMEFLLILGIGVSVILLWLVLFYTIKASKKAKHNVKISEVLGSKNNKMDIDYEELRNAASLRSTTSTRSTDTTRKEGVASLASMAEIIEDKKGEQS